jgi:hypothetical protein
MDSVGEHLSCVRFELATGQSSAQTMSESDDEVHFGVILDIDSGSNDTGNYVRASASTGKLRRNLLKKKSKQEQNSQPAMLGTRTNAFNVLGKKR